MAEQRLIDANALDREAEESLRENPHTESVHRAMHTHEHNHFLCMIAHQPTIDPETMPVVRQLREELDRVTAERDAAVSDLENIMAYNSDTCQSCKNNQCYVRGGTKPCLPKWRGPQKEE